MSTAQLVAASGGYVEVRFSAGDAVLVASLVAVAYLLGSIPSAVLVARRRAVDIRAVGDRNPGFWNTMVTFGFRASVPVLAADALKGMAAAALGVALRQRLGYHGHDGDPGWWLPYACGLAAMVGHAWPVFARFRGGRCVLTFLGAWVVINPVELLIALGVCLVLYALTRRFGLAARLGVFALPVVQAFADARAHVAMTGAMLSLIGLRFWQAHRAGHGSHVV